MSTLLRWLGIALYRLRLHRVLIALTPRAPRIVAYHACDETESTFTEGLNINTPPKLLAAQMDFLAGCYRVVALDILESGTYPDRALVVTFDDGFRSVHEKALPILAARNIPATVYLVASTLDGSRLVWVNELNWFLRKHATEAPRIACHYFGLVETPSAATLLGHAQEKPPAEIEALLERLAMELNVDRHALARSANLFVTRDGAADMAHSGITFGNHTDTHPNLARCGPDRLRDELSAGLRSGIPGLRSSLAYPFGRFNDGVRTLARSIGHQSILQIGGVNRPFDPLRLARTPVSTQTPAELFADLEVVAPVKQIIRRLLGRAPYGHSR